MSTKPHRTYWNRPVIGLAITAMGFIGGCGVGDIAPYPTPTYSAETPPSGLSSGPVKYAFATFKSCSEIQQKVPNLPSPLAPQRSADSARLSQNCTFSASTTHIIFEVELYENLQDASGPVRAMTDYNAPLLGMEKDSSVSIGSDARWADLEAGGSCTLEILDENAVISFNYYNSSKEAQEDPASRSEKCREGAREVAKQIYAAVQPQ
jgi:hypothetical protein